VKDNKATVVGSPLGDLILIREGQELVSLYFIGHRPTATNSSFAPRRGVDRGKEVQLDEYFAGTRRTFELSMRACGSAHERRIWALVAQIPYGSTTTYGQLARQLDDGTTAREVGAAVGRNPLCILIPCHRVVGAGDKLTGYAGGLARKRLLLDLEQRTIGSRGKLF
jgi:methylated-DNA-[protein]-cysteine S-methyltransferase